MEKESARKRVIKILDNVPELKEILISSDPIDEKRQKIRYFLSDILNATLVDNPTIPPLEWIMARNAFNVFRSILSTRSERLVGYSFIRYIDDLLNKDDLKGIEKPSPGFFAEVEHLVKGVVGKTQDDH